MPKPIARISSDLPMRQWMKVAVCAAIAACGAGEALASTQKVVVADFEDFGTWRMRDSKGMLPGAVWPMDANLSGTDKQKFHGDAVGELKFHFDPDGKGPFYAGFERYKMSLVSGFIAGIEFDANANGLPVMMRFQIVDGTGEKFTTRPVAIAGTGCSTIASTSLPRLSPTSRAASSLRGSIASS